MKSMIVLGRSEVTCLCPVNINNQKTFECHPIIDCARLLPELLARHVITSGDSVMDSIKTAKIAAIVRCIMEQMNLSKPDKDPADYIKNVGEFHYEHSVGAIFTTWHARNRDIYEHRMAG
ncbi:hypothetical protein ACTXT7_017327, partial [Hymenolepis weldensis]